MTQGLAQTYDVLANRKTSKKIQVNNICLSKVNDIAFLNATDS